MNLRPGYFKAPPVTDGALLIIFPGDWLKRESAIDLRRKIGLYGYADLAYVPACAINNPKQVMNASS